MSMVDWKSKQIEKKRKGSQTPGSAKGDSCKASAMQRYFAKSSRARYHPYYGAWCEKMDKLNGMKR